MNRPIYGRFILSGEKKQWIFQKILSSYLLKWTDQYMVGSF